MRHDPASISPPHRSLTHRSLLAVLIAASVLAGVGARADAKPVVHGCSQPLPGAGRVTGNGIVRPGGRACDKAVAGEPLRVLVFSRTAGFRHASIADAHDFFASLPEREGIAATITEDPEQFDDDVLATFDVVVFANTTGDVLNDAQQAALERFVRAGHGWVGVHSAADTEYEWNWYGKLVGAYFTSHPILPVEVEVTTEDGEHPSTDHLPGKFLFTDEIYNFDRNPRFDNAILLTVDEAGFIYPNFPGGPSMGPDHPIAWYKEYDGGRSFYTNLGHRPDSWRDPRFQEHLLDGIRWAAGPPTWSAIPVSRQARNPLTMDVAPDGRVFYVERTGEVWVWSPKSGRVSLAAQFDVSLYGENGLLGIALDPDFARTPWVYLFYALDDFDPPADYDADALPYEGPLGENVLARLRLADDGTLDLDSYEELLRTPSERVGGHEGGQITFLPDGTLVLSVGDNTNPFGDAFGFAPLDNRPERDRYDARRTASNPFDLRGKLLRLNSDGSIPRGNLFPRDGSAGRPEVYVMGARNPFRTAADPQTGRLYFGDVGPDAPLDGPRGPRGYDEVNVVDGPGNYGWPFCIGENHAYNAYDYATGEVGAPYSCAGTIPPVLAYDYLTVSELALGNARDQNGGLTGRSAMAGAVVRRPPGKAPFRLPDTYEGALFMTDWTRDVIAAVEVDRRGKLERVRRVAPWIPLHRPIDLEIGPDGALYVLEYGTGYGGNNDDAQLTRIEYSPDGDLTPVAVASASRTAGIVPLTVHLSAAGSRAPGANGVITAYAWDVDGDGTTDYTTPEVDHTFTAGGVQYASLVITDGAGRESFPDVVEITTGNEPPVVTIEEPAAGTVVARGAKITVRGSATDREDGVARCDRLSWDIRLGHT
ncbi:ThuA domain-containing protein, partial [Candidatus Binatia bacterium]|nr:ThuA domain-containing protein [Candidatus Binatia bacterium]